MTNDLYIGRRLSYDGSLCTLRFIGPLTGTKGEWLGIEWDDPSRGKHNGTHQGQQIFRCLRNSSNTSASFVRPTRPNDPERTVLEAIKYKYGTGSDAGTSDPPVEAVIISGKVAEEVGFDKIAAEQAQLLDLRVVLLDDLVVHGVARRGASLAEIRIAQKELAETCPNITELDLGWNPIETWQSISDVCAALPRLQILKVGGFRLREFGRSHSQGVGTPFQNIHGLHMDECLVNADQILETIYNPSDFPNLTTISLSQNELSSFDFVLSRPTPVFQSVKTIVLDNNNFSKLESLSNILDVCPSTTTISFQGCKVKNIEERITQPLRNGERQRYSHQFSQIQTLDVSRNRIESYDFIDVLPEIFPNLTSLRISHNPLYSHSFSNAHEENTPTVDAKASERAYYLTLARIPKLQMLNHTKITTRDREEGEMYYLSVTEKHLLSFLLSATKPSYYPTPSSSASFPSLLQSNPAPVPSRSPSDLPATALSDPDAIPESSPANPTFQSNSIRNPSPWPLASDKYADTAAAAILPKPRSTNVESSVVQQEEQQVQPLSGQEKQYKRKSYTGRSRSESSTETQWRLKSQVTIAAKEEKAEEKVSSPAESGRVPMKTGSRIASQIQESRGSNLGITVGAGSNSVVIRSSGDDDAAVSNARIRLRWVAKEAEWKFPRYQDLCTRYGRESLITRLLTVESLLVARLTGDVSNNAVDVSQGEVVPLRQSSSVSLAGVASSNGVVLVNVDGSIDEPSLRSVLVQQSSSSSAVSGEISSSESKSYPRGSVGARLVQCTFYVQQDSSLPSAHPHPPPTTTNKIRYNDKTGDQPDSTLTNAQTILTRPIPRTLPTNTLKALLVRHFHPLLQPLQFRLIYESRELDPVGLTAEASTRSQGLGHHGNKNMKGEEERWAEWGEWDADEVVEAAWREMATMSERQDAVESEVVVDTRRDGSDGEGLVVVLVGEDGSHGERMGGEAGGHETWTDEGYLIREGRKWKRREVEILSGMRSWGDWIEDGVQDVRVRIEPFPPRRHPQ